MWGGEGVTGTRGAVERGRGDWDEERCGAGKW